MLLKHCFHVTYCLLGILVYHSTATSASMAEPEQSYDILYNQAIEAYLEENWEKCIVKMNEANEDYHFYKDAVVGEHTLWFVYGFRVNLITFFNFRLSFEMPKGVFGKCSYFSSVGRHEIMGEDDKTNSLYSKVQEEYSEESS